MKRSAFVSLVLFAVAWGPSSAQAGPWQDVFQGLDYVATPLGSPLSTAADGTRINGARSGRVRIVPNGMFGDGYRLEFDRTFGADSRGRPETLRLPGGLQASLSGATQLTAGYNSLAGPIKSAFADFTASSLSYDLRSRNGAQDIELTGTLNVAGSLNINTLGFYDLTFDASNTGSSLKVDGVAVRDQQPTNFDVGPIAIKGNIFWDGALALLDGLGVDTAGLHDIFPDSPIDQINQALSGQLTGADLLGGATSTNDLASLLVQTILGGSDKAGNALMTGLADGSLHGEQDSPPPVNVPEPGTLLLATVGATLLWFRRRRASLAARSFGPRVA